MLNQCLTDLIKFHFNCSYSMKHNSTVNKFGLDAYSKKC